MKNLDLTTLVIISIVMLVLALTEYPVKYTKDIYSVDKFEMTEPFSLGPLVTYSMKIPISIIKSEEC